MKKTLITLIGFFVIGVSNANALVHNNNVKINEIIEWNNNSPIHLLLSNGNRCYVPSTEKNLYSLVLTLFTSAKSSDIVCFDSEEETNGFLAHRIHRVIAK